MSFEAMGWALQQRDTKSAAKFVLLMVAYREWHHPPYGCFISINELAADCGLDRATVIRVLKKLVEAKKVEQHKRAEAGKGKLSSFYWFPTVRGVYDAEKIKRGLSAASVPPNQPKEPRKDAATRNSGADLDRRNRQALAEDLSGIRESL